MEVIFPNSNAGVDELRAAAKNDDVLYKELLLDHIQGYNCTFFAHTAIIIITNNNY